MRFLIVLRKRAALIGILAVFISFCCAARALACAQAVPKEPLCSVKTVQNAAAVTFDADTDAEQIPAILRALRSKNVKATFFVTGVWTEKYPRTLRQIAQEGHEIGCHGDLHRDLTAMTEEQQRQDLVACRKKIKAACGVEPKWLRPPYRRWNDALLRQAHELGLHLADCSAMTDDWRNVAPAVISEQAINRLQPGGILLLNCSGLNTATALPHILQALQSRGISLRTVSQLAALA